MRFLGFLCEPAIVTETYTTSEANKQVVNAENAAGTSTEEGENKVEDQKTLSIDDVLFMSVANGSSSNVSYSNSIYSTKDTFIKDCDADPVDRKSTRLNSSHSGESRMPSSA